MSAAQTRIAIRNATELAGPLPTQGEARRSTTCPACLKDKGAGGGLVCWECWRQAPHGGAGLKYSCMTFDDWLADVAERRRHT